MTLKCGLCVHGFPAESWEVYRRCRQIKQVVLNFCMVSIKRKKKCLLLFCMTQLWIWFVYKNSKWKGLTVTGGRGGLITNTQYCALTMQSSSGLVLCLWFCFPSAFRS